MPPLSRKVPVRGPRPLARPSYANDERLVEGLLGGEHRAAEVLYDRLRPVIDHALRRVLRDRYADVDDLMQVTFERVIGSLVQGRFQRRSSLTTWAAAIAAHVALDSLRRRIREHRVFQQADPEALELARTPTHSVERRLEARLEIRRLHAVLCRMKPNLADALLLHDVLGYELSEVAELTGVGISTAQSRLFRARKELLRRAGAAIPQRGPA